MIIKDSSPVIFVIKGHVVESVRTYKYLETVTDCALKQILIRKKGRQRLFKETEVFHCWQDTDNHVLQSFYSVNSVFFYDLSVWRSKCEK